MSAELIKALELKPHPLGGHYRTTYRSDITVSTDGTRSIATALYYYLGSSEMCTWHRCPADRILNFVAGSSMTVHTLDKDNDLMSRRFGNPLNNPVFNAQVMVPANTWVSAETDTEGGFTLMTWFVVPYVSVADVEMAQVDSFVSEFPKHGEIIKRLVQG